MIGSALAAAGCAHAQSSSNTTGSVATPAPVATSEPAARVPAGAPARPKAAAGSAAPSLAPPSAPAPVVRSTDAAVSAPEPAATGPRIYAVSATPTVVHAGQSVAFSVRTSTDVAHVTAKVSAYAFPLIHVAPGRFSLAFAIPPNVPGFFHGTYALDMIASDKSGSSVSRSLQITFQ